MPHLKTATEQDLKQASYLLKRLHKSSVYSNTVSFIQSDVEQVLLNIINGGLEKGSVVLLYDDDLCGILVCSSMQQLFNQKEKTAVELGFYITPEKRTFKNYKLLLGAYRYWAKLTNCTSILLGRLKDSSSIETYKLRRL